MFRWRGGSSSSSRSSIFRKHMVVRGGERRDSAYYSVIDDEWPRVRENLRRRLARSAGLGEAGEPRAAT
jgi:hypothetical protein